ncbi:hypothetical protein Tco_1118314 [Tanacetum coccineum]
MSVKYPNYVNLTSLSEEQPNEITPSPPPRKKSLLSPQALSKSISSKSTHYTSSSSPTVRQAQLVDTDTESKPEEAPSEAEESQPLGSRVPLMSKEFEASEPSEDESSDLDDEREGRGMDDEGQGLDEEGQGLKDKGPGIEEEEEEAALEGRQQAVSVVDTAASEPLGLGYKAARRRALESTKEIAPSTYEVGQSSRSVPEKEGAERIYAFRQPTLVTWVDPEDGRVYTDIPTYVPPVAPGFEELYTRLGAVRDEIFSQRYRFRSLEREQERATMTFSAIWRLILALEAWVGQTDAQRVALWHVIYDIQRENHDLRRQIAEERREQLELTDCVARIERRQESRGE